jgi:chaperonin GroEL
MAKRILYQDTARRALERGMEIMVEAVAVTLGPKGRNVVLGKPFGAPQIVNDGVTIAKEISLEDHIENTGVSLIRQAAAKTNDVAGDGTTTATVLAYAIVKEGMRNVTAGANPISLKIGIEKASKYLVESIIEASKPIDSLEAISQVASISAGNDVEVGEMIAKAIEQVGNDGVISLEEGNSITTELEVTEGMEFEKGYLSPYFVTDSERLECVYEDCFILLTDKKITLVEQDLVPILEQVTNAGKPLLIIADDMEKEALATVVLNKLRRILNVVVVRSPGFGDRRKQYLEDIAIMTGGQVITEDAGLNLESVTLDLLGQAKRIVVTKDTTTLITEGQEESVQKRCEQLRKQMAIIDSAYEKEKLQDRVAKLAGGVAVIKVGAATETEMREKKLRLEDAINATKAAIEEGIVPGGGATLVHLSESLETWAKKNLKEDELIGGLILARAINAPLRKIVENSGQNGSIIIERLYDSSFNIGYDASLNVVADMYEKGIIDPAKVTRSAVQNAASIASMVLTTECIIVDKTNEEPST